jgi:hypothetical protein
MNNSYRDLPGEAGHHKRKTMDLSPAVNFLTSSPLTGEDEGEGALIFLPLTLALSRQGRENTSPYIVQQAKYFVGSRLIPAECCHFCAEHSS